MEEKKEIDPKDLPESEVFKKKEVYQYPQPADMGKPLKPDPAKDDQSTEQGKENNKTSKTEGLNEERAPNTNDTVDGSQNQGSDI